MEMTMAMVRPMHRADTAPLGRRGLRSSTTTKTKKARKAVPMASANIACKLLTTIGGAETLGPILMGMTRPVHLLPRGAEVEEIVNVVAIAVVDARESELVMPEVTKSIARAD